MQVRYISLGEIVPPDIRKTMDAFIDYVMKVKSGSKREDIAKSIGGVLQAKYGLITAFKHSQVKEADFDNEMINAIGDATGVSLTIDEFNTLWNAGNPKFAQFEKTLRQAIAFNKQENKKLVAISGTNIKDTRHLEAELEKGEIPFKKQGEHLVEIDGLRLIATCATGKTKTDILAEEVKHARGFSLTQPADIKYICGANDLKDPQLKPAKDVIDRTNAEIKEQINIEITLWDKAKYPELNDVLSGKEVSFNPFVIAAANSK